MPGHVAEGLIRAQFGRISSVIRDLGMTHLIRETAVRGFNYSDFPPGFVAGGLERGDSGILQAMIPAPIHRSNVKADKVAVMDGATKAAPPAAESAHVKTARFT